MFFIKQFKFYLFNPLQHIINRSLVTGFVPHQFKIAKVIPLFKSCDKSSPDNYRPISLLSCFSKILEKVVGHRLVSFLELNIILLLLRSLDFVKTTLRYTNWFTL
jgi:hypothetical protein